MGRVLFVGGKSGMTAPALSPRLTFSAPTSFSISAVTPGWNGTIEYAIDDGAWQEWDGSAITGTTIYMRGTNNTIITGTTDTTRNWSLIGSNVSCSGNAEALLDYQTVGAGNHPTMGECCFNDIFYQWTGLISAPEVPATTLSRYCYGGMFYGCTNLTEPPVLPATTLSEGCYYGMFWNCSSLKSVPELPAATMADTCYKYMFANCTSLDTLPELPATTLAYGCYEYMFSGCTNIKLSEIKAELYARPYRIPTDGTGSTANSALNGMFASTGGTFTGTPQINTTYYLFVLDLPFTLSAPETFSLSVETPGWDGTMEYSTDATTWNTWDGSEISGTKLYLRGAGNTKVIGLNMSMRGWTLTGSDIACSGNIENLLDYQTVLAGSHPTMAAYCYYFMFRDCTAITTPPALPATTLSDHCYHGMFYDCSRLTAAPELPATVLVNGCYSCMFYRCVSLTTAPALPATTLAGSCYSSMFDECTNLAAAPALPATTLAGSCYQSMFQGCSHLTTMPELPATTLASYCYRYMFYGCTSLTTAPALPATTLADSCYSYMFYNCTALKLSATQTAGYTQEYRIPTSGEGTTATNALSRMFDGTGGTFTGTPEINTTYYLHNDDPVVPSTSYLTFTAPESFSISVSSPGWDGTMEYSTDLSTWNTWDGSEISGTALYLRGTGNTRVTGVNWEMYAWTLTGSNVTCTGNIENLLDYQTVSNGSHPAMAECCYSYMFYGWDGLISAPELPATALTESCYESMFDSCTGLTTAPALPTTTLADMCYYTMFYGCTALVAAPKLPATTLQNECYGGMFSDCTSLKFSTTQTADYTQEYRVPTSGEGTTALYSLNDMFAGTGGTFTGTPTINTTYYLHKDCSLVG